MKADVSGWGVCPLGFDASWTLARLAPDTAMRLSRTQPDGGEKLGALIGAIDRLPQLFQHLPLTDFPLLAEAAPYFYDWLAHPDDDDYWARWNIEGPARLRQGAGLQRRRLA